MKLYSTVQFMVNNLIQSESFYTYIRTYTVMSSNICWRCFPVYLSDHQISVLSIKSSRSFPGICFILFLGGAGLSSFFSLITHRMLFTHDCQSINKSSVVFQMTRTSWLSRSHTPDWPGRLIRVTGI
jgi:hypothetical protein